MNEEIEQSQSEVTAEPPRRNKGGRPKGSGKRKAVYHRPAPAPTASAGLGPEETPKTAPARPSGASASAAERYRKAVQSGSFTRRLPARDIAGFKLRFVNDEVGRIHQFTEMGWDFVTNEEQGFSGASSDPGDKYSVVVGTSSAGKELRAYLLKIPEEWYDHFQRIEREQFAKVEKQIKSGQVNRKDGDGRYEPKTKIKVQETLT